MSTIKNKPDHSPKEKKELPLGNWHPLPLSAINSFALKFERQPLTTVSDSKAYSQLLNSGLNGEVSDTTGDDSSNAAWTIKIFLN